MDRRPASCFSCEGRLQNAWCALEGDDLHLLNQSKICHRYEPGQTIFYQGNPCLGVYCIEEGTVALRKTDAAGNSVLVRILSKGEALGYRTYFSGGNYAASAEALSESRVCFVGRSAVQRLLELNPAVGFSFLKRMGDDLKDAEEAKLHVASLPVRARLSHLLLALKDRFGSVREDGTLTIALPLSRQDMAAMIGTRPETIARTIKALETDGVALFEGRQVIVGDLDALLDEIEVS